MFEHDQDWGYGRKQSITQGVMMQDIPKGKMIYIDSSVWIIQKKYQLFPRDATHLSQMQSMNISDIVTTDSDFDKIREITVWNP